MGSNDLLNQKKDFEERLQLRVSEGDYLMKTSYTLLTNQVQDDLEDDVQEVEINDHWTHTLVKHKHFIFWALVVILAGAGNSICGTAVLLSTQTLKGKIVSVPLADYIFFISVFNAIVYVIVYFTILAGKVLLKITPREQLRYIWFPRDTGNCAERFPPVKYFIAMGLLDGLQILLSFLGRSQLPGIVM
jgi:hypothetical protein